MWISDRGFELRESSPEANSKSEIANPQSLGTASAEDEDGKHEMKRAPAANTSLSAASRCASRPPSDPSV